MSKRSAEQGPDRRLEMVGSYSMPEPAPDPAAEDELRRAERLVIEGERAGLDDLEMGMRLGDMVRICFARQAYAEAVPPLTRLLALNRAQGDDRPEVATVLSSLATARYALGEHNEAAQLWEEALRIREQWLVPNHFMIARSVENLADARVAQGRMDEALALLRRALSIWQQTLPPTDPTVRAIRTKIGDLQLSSSQELPSRVPTGHRPPAPPAPMRLGGYTPESMGPQGIQSVRELPSTPVAPAAPAPPLAVLSAMPAPVSAPAPVIAPAPVSAPAPVPTVVSAAAPLLMTERPADTFVAPRVELPPVVEAAAPLLVVAPDAPPAAEAAAAAPAAEHRAQFPQSWLQLGRSLALSAPESVLEQPLEPMPEDAGAADSNALRSRRAAVLAAPLVVVLLALAAAYQLGGSDSPAPVQAANVPPAISGPTRAASPARSAGVVRTASAGQVALDGRQRTVVPASRVQPDETETVARELARTRGAASSSAEDKRAPRAADAASSVKPLSAAASAQLADAMKAVEASTVVGADSAVRRMLYGGALSSDAVAAPTRAAAPSAPVATRATAEEASDMKPAMVAPGGVQPVFPFQLLSENVTGTVVVEVLVDAQGHADARTARVVRSSHPLFTAAVMRALPTMRFVPAEAHGQKVAQRLEVPFRFDRKTAGQ